MTDRTRSLVVVLDQPYRDDDVQSIVDAIKMIRGVIAVDIRVTDPAEYVAIESARADLRHKLWKALEDKKK